MAGRKLFIGSLPNGIQEATIREEFTKYGTVEDVFVKPGCEAGRQWGFVTLSTQQAAQAAKEATDRILQFPGGDKTCDVMVAKNQGAGDSAPAMAAPVMGMGMPMMGMAPAAASQAPKKIFIGSMPNSITDAELRDEFKKYGNIVDVHLNNKDVETNRQWAFITFDNPEQAQAAKTATDRVLQFPGADRACEVTLARHQGMFGQESLSQDGSGLAAVAPGPKKVFCGSLPQAVTMEELKKEFSKYGQVLDCHLNSKPCDPGKNWAFITFATPESALAAKDATDKILTFPGAERACEVMIAKNQGKNGSEPMGGSSATSALAVQPYPGLTAAAGFPMGYGYGYPPPMWPAPAPHAGMTPWRMYKTTAGLPYYHNHTTGQTCWECPPELMQAPQPCAAYGAMPTMPHYPPVGYAPY